MQILTILQNETDTPPGLSYLTKSLGSLKIRNIPYNIHTEKEREGERERVRDLRRELWRELGRKREGRMETRVKIYYAHTVRFASNIT